MFYFILLFDAAKVQTKNGTHFHNICSFIRYICKQNKKYDYGDIGT